SDPEIRYSGAGAKFAEVSIATTQSWKDKNTGQPRESTEWHPCVFSGALADIVDKYLTKGAKVYVEGSLHTSRWTDAQQIERSRTVIRVKEMELLGQRDNSSASNNNVSRNNQSNRSSGADSQPSAGYQVPPSASTGGFG